MKEEGDKDGDEAERKMKSSTEQQSNKSEKYGMLCSCLRAIRYGCGLLYISIKSSHTNVSRRIYRISWQMVWQRIVVVAAAQRWWVGGGGAERNEYLIGHKIRNKWRCSQLAFYLQITSHSHIHSHRRHRWRCRCRLISNVINDIKTNVVFKPLPRASHIVNEEMRPIEL